MKERVEYRIDSFTDYANIERKFIMVVVSQEVDAVITDYSDSDAVHCDGVKKLSIGVAICNPEDEFNEEVGKTIALGKARKGNKHAFYSTDSGLINRGVVNALLDQEVAFFKQCPGKYIAGYNTAKEVYELDSRMVEVELNLNDKERECLDTLLTASPEKVNDIVDLYNHYYLQ